MPRVFISFDFDHDEDLRLLLVGQSRNPRTPFTLANWSVKEAMAGDWKGKVRSRIRSLDKMIVICGEQTDTATGVSAEVQIAREEGKPVYFLKGRANKVCKLPKAAQPTDRMLDWTWENLAATLGMPTASPETDFMPLGEMAAWGIGLGAAYLAWRAFTNREPVRNPLRGTP